MAKLPKKNKALEVTKDWFGRRADESYTFYDPSKRTVNWDKDKDSLIGNLLRGKSLKDLKNAARLLDSMFSAIGLSKKTRRTPGLPRKIDQVQVPVQMLKNEETGDFSLAARQADSFIGLSLENAALAGLQTKTEYQKTIDASLSKSGRFNLPGYLFTLLNRERVAKLLSEKRPGYMKFIQKYKDEQFDDKYEPLEATAPAHLRLLDLVTRLIRFPKHVTEDELKEFEEPLSELGKLVKKHEGVPATLRACEALGASMAKIITDFAPPVDEVLPESLPMGPLMPMEEQEELPEDYNQHVKMEAEVPAGQEAREDHQNSPEDNWNEPEEKEDDGKSENSGSSDHDAAASESSASPDSDQDTDEDGVSGKQSTDSNESDSSTTSGGGSPSLNDDDDSDEDSSDAFDDDDLDGDDLDSGSMGAAGSSPLEEDDDSDDDEDNLGGVADLPDLDDDEDEDSRSNASSGGGGGSSDADPDDDSDDDLDDVLEDELDEDDDEDEDSTGSGATTPDTDDDDANESLRSSSNTEPGSDTDDDDDSDETGFGDDDLDSDDDSEDDESEDDAFGEDEDDDAPFESSEDLSELDSSSSTTSDKQNARQRAEQAESDDEPEEELDARQERENNLKDRAKELADQLFEDLDESELDSDAQDELDRAMNDLTPREANPQASEDLHNGAMDQIGVAADDPVHVSWIIEKGNPVKYKAVKDKLNMVQAGVIRKLFVSKHKDQQLSIKGMKSGQLDVSKIAEAVQGVPTVYERMGRVLTNKICVGVLIDESGSMSGGLDYNGYAANQSAGMDRAEAYEIYQDSNKIGKARQAAIFLNECFSKVPDVQFFVYGHTADEKVRGYNSREQMAGKYGSCEMRVYREPGVRCDPTSLGNLTSRSNNRDGKAILLTALRIRKFTEDPGIIVVISDGQPAGTHYNGQAAIEDTRQQVGIVERMGFTVIQVAIEAAVPSEQMFNHYVTMTDIQTLPRDLVAFMTRQMSKMIKTRYKM